MSLSGFSLSHCFNDLLPSDVGVPKMVSVRSWMKLISITHGGKEIRHQRL